MYTCAYNIDLRNIGLLLIRNLQRQIRTARIIYLVEPDLETDGLFRPDCTLLSLKILK